MGSTQEFFIRNLIKYRGERSMLSIAEAANLSLRQYSRYESGESWPPPETIEAISNALSVEPWQLLKDPHKKETAAILSSKDLSFADAASIVDMFQGSKPVKRKLVLGVLREDEDLMREALTEFPGLIPTAKEV